MYSLPLEHSLPMQFRQVACSLKVETVSLEAPIGCTRTGNGVQESA
jgi:hypothetical protein